MDYLAGQIDKLFALLDRAGALNRMTVVMHGDHGSRIRRILDHAPGAQGFGEEVVMPEALDYQGRPDARDLVDRFSTLLAVKKAGAAAPAECDERHSLLTFLARSVFGREPEDGLEKSDLVYLVNARGMLAPIDIQSYWR